MRVRDAVYLTTNPNKIIIKTAVSVEYAALRVGRLMPDGPSLVGGNPDKHSKRAEKKQSRKLTLSPQSTSRTALISS
jgi:hypothetical protein